MTKTINVRRCHSLVPLIAVGLWALSLSIEPATATSMDMTVDKLLDICAASSVQIASERGDTLGWQKLTDAETDEWRNTFIGYDVASVKMVGWQRKVVGRPEYLLFWANARLPDLKTCSYSTPNAAGILDGMSEVLGPPDNLDKDDVAKSVTALWLRNEVEYSFVQVRSSAIVTISPQR